MVSKWQIVYTNQANKDSLKLKSVGLKPKTLILLNLISKNPFQNPPNYEKLKGDLSGFYSRRINRQHRLVYQVFKNKKIIKIVRMWTHYE